MPGRTSKSPPYPFLGASAFRPGRTSTAHGDLLLGCGCCGGPLLLEGFVLCQQFVIALLRHAIPFTQGGLNIARQQALRAKLRIGTRRLALAIVENLRP